jgi:RNA polymerase sigma-70 factor (ECF subfamily)
MKPGAAGNEEILAGLLRIRDRATALAYAVLRDFQAAEDAYQEASLVALRRMEEFTGEGFEKWFWRILRNILGTRLRSARRSRIRAASEILERLEAVSLEDPVPAEPEENVQWLSECLSRLGGRVEEILRWRFLEGLHVPEIARRLGRTVQATYALLKRSRQALRECVRLRAQSAATGN